MGPQNSSSEPQNRLEIVVPVKKQRKEPLAFSADSISLGMVLPFVKFLMEQASDLRLYCHFNARRFSSRMECNLTSSLRSSSLSRVRHHIVEAPRVIECNNYLVGLTSRPLSAAF
jgi:hypothetical protein